MKAAPTPLDMSCDVRVGLAGLPLAWAAFTIGPDHFWWLTAYEPSCLAEQDDTEEFSLGSGHNDQGCRSSIHPFDKPG